MSNTSLFVVVAQFDLDPKDRETFVQALLANRKETVTTEHGCRMYEVCIPEDNAGRVVLIEFYDNRAAFDTHHATAHWHRWNDTAAHLIKERTVTFMSRRL
jgi:quinol monooxygenase YgiN